MDNPLFCPTASSQIEKFMLARMGRLKPGDDVGVYAHSLPKSKRGVPAALPDWAETGDGKSDKEDERDDNDEEDNDDENDEKNSNSDEESESPIPDKGWSVKKKGNTWYLMHAELNKSVELGPPEKNYKWQIYEKKRVQWIWQGQEAEEEGECDACECSEIYNQIATAEADYQKSKTRGSMPKGNLKKDPPEEGQVLSNVQTLRVIICPRLFNYFTVSRFQEWRFAVLSQGFSMLNEINCLFFIVASGVRGPTPKAKLETLAEDADDDFGVSDTEEKKPTDEADKAEQEQQLIR